MKRAIEKHTCGLTTWEKACRAFADNLKTSAKAFADQYVAHLDAGFMPCELHEALPDFSERVWSRLELIGRDQMAPELLWYRGPTRVAKLSPADFERVKKDGGIDVLTGDGKTVRRVALANLGYSEAHLAISESGKLLTQREQFAVWQKEQRELEKSQAKRLASQRASRQHQGWMLYEDGRCKINGVIFSKSQMLEMFRDWQDVVL